MLNCCVDLDDVKRTGITLPAFHCLAVCQGLGSTVGYADESSEREFRDAVVDACVERDGDVGDEDGDDDDDRLDQLLVVSYNRQGVGQTGTGHFSPVGAYDPESDQVLVMDTARFKYGLHWVPLNLLFKSMLDIDPDTNRSRGYVVLRNHEDEGDDDSVHKAAEGKEESATSMKLPISVLFRSKMSQNGARYEYKRFLDGLERGTDGSKMITWPQIVDFWTKNGTDQDYVWESTSPRLKPIFHDDDDDDDDDDNSDNNNVDNTSNMMMSKLIRQVRSLIAHLISKQQESSEDAGATTGASLIKQNSGCCARNVSVNKRTIDLTPEEAIFVMYLASLDETECDKVIFGTRSGDEKDGNNDGTRPDTEIEYPDEVRRQLRSEAQLVRYALDVSEAMRRESLTH